MTQLSMPVMKHTWRMKEIVIQVTLMSIKCAALEREM